MPKRKNSTVHELYSIIFFYTRMEFSWHKPNVTWHAWNRTSKNYRMLNTGWRRLIGSPKLQIIFHKTATKYRSLLQKMTCKDQASYGSLPPCTTDRSVFDIIFFIHACISHVVKKILSSKLGIRWTKMNRIRPCFCIRACIYYGININETWHAQ